MLQMHADLQVSFRNRAFGDTRPYVPFLASGDVIGQLGDDQLPELIVRPRRDHPGRGMPAARVSDLLVLIGASEIAKGAYAATRAPALVPVTTLGIVPDLRKAETTPKWSVGYRNGIRHELVTTIRTKRGGGLTVAERSPAGEAES